MGVIDEGRYNPSMSSDLLKITGGENTIVEKKYSYEHIKIEPIPLIMSSNNCFEDKDPSINEALNNRMFVIEFLEYLGQKNNDTTFKFKSKLKDEEPNIMIFCNKVFFNKNDNNKLGNKISNIKILEIINKNLK